MNTTTTKTVSAKKTIKTNAPIKKTAQASKVPSTKKVAPVKAKTTSLVKKAPIKVAKEVTAKPSLEKNKAHEKKSHANKEKKVKVLRDSFTIPKNEYAIIDTLKVRASRLLKPAKKSELLRAGLKVLANMDDKQFALALASVPNIKTGRPAGV